MKKLLVLLASLTTLFLGSTAQAALLPDPSDLHINDGTAFLFGTEVHPLSNPLVISLAGHPFVTFDEINLILCVPNSTTAPPVATSPSATPVDMGTLTAGEEVYGDVLGLGAIFDLSGLNSNPNNSVSFTNLAAADLAVNGITATSFEIWQYVLDATDPVSVTLAALPDVGTFAVAWGIGTDTKKDTQAGYVVPFTQSGLVQQVPEPGMLLLLGSGLVGIALYRRRKA